MRFNKWSFIFIFILLFVSIICYFVFTHSGSKNVSNLILANYFPSKELQYEITEGNLIEGMKFADLEFSNLAELPEHSILRIQNLKIQLVSLSLDGLQVEVENMRLMLPESEPIVVSGSIKGSNLDLNVYSSSVSIEEIVELLKDKVKVKKIKGLISGIDLYVTGQLKKPTIKGDLLVSELIYEKVKVRNAPVSLDLVVQSNKKMEISGDVLIHSGDVSANLTKVKILESKIHFDKVVKNPVLNIQGTSEIDRIKIKLSIKGTKEKPDIKVSSEPSLPRQSLLIMLATGKRMHGAEELINQGVISQELASDFLDYFIFGNKGDAFAKKVGLSSISLKVNQNTQGITVRKDVTDKLDLGYGVEQQKSGLDQQKNIQRVDGNLQVTDKVSVTAGRELQKTSNESDSNEVERVDNKVLLKFKKSF